MPRNLDRRVEATVEVMDPELRARLQQILDISLSDDMLAWTMSPDGTYTKVPTVQGIEAHEVLQDLPSPGRTRVMGSLAVSDTAKAVSPRRSGGRSSAR